MSRITLALIAAAGALAPTAAYAQKLARAAVPRVTYSSATRPLYQFRRDDAASVTRIHIAAGHQGSTPLSQNVFGNFIEHLGNAIYEILWANVLLNPNLEKIADADKAPPAWQMAGAATWADGTGYVSPRAVRLSGPGATLSQRVYLPVHRIRRYTLTFFLRAATGSGQATVAVHAGDAIDGPVVASQSFPVGRGIWHLQTIHFEVRSGALGRGQAARFVVTGGDGDVDVDQFQLFPDDAVDGMDPDTLRLAREWDIPILRLAGNFSSGYHWRDGVGPRLARPTHKNVAWGDALETNHFGTDEFFDLARLIGNVPTQIAVNAGNGTPEEAADWVRYCEEHHFPVASWEIGNELYGNWQIGHTDPAGMADRYVKFRKALFAVDPNLNLMVTGKADEFQPDGIGRDKNWNTTVLKAAVANDGKSPDYLTIHPLVPLPGGLGGLPYHERWESAMAHPAFMDQTLLPELIREITATEGPGAKTRIAPTEWGIIIGGGGWEQGPNHNVEAGAIYNALALNTFLRNGDWVTLANMTALLHGGCIKKSNGIVYVDPQYYTQKLYADAHPRIPIETDTTGPGKDVPARGFLPAAKDVPDVDVFSALTPDRSHMVVFAVNRTLNDARPVSLSMDGFTPGRISGTILTSADPQAGNSWDKPDVVAPRPFVVAGNATGKAFDFTIPAHSLVEVIFARKAER